MHIGNSRCGPFVYLNTKTRSEEIQLQVGLLLAALSFTAHCLPQSVRIDEPHGLPAAGCFACIGVVVPHLLPTKYALGVEDPIPRNAPHVGVVVAHRFSRVGWRRDPNAQRSAAPVLPCAPLGGPPLDGAETLLDEF